MRTPCPTRDTPPCSTSIAAQDGAQHPSYELSSDLRADRPRRALAERFEHPLRLLASARPGLAEKDIGHGRRHRGSGRRLFRMAAPQFLVRGLAVNRSIVLAGVGRTAQRRLALVLRDRSELASG